MNGTVGMSFSQNTPYYNPNQMLTTVAQQAQSRTVLFLFQPLARSFTDQYHRPLTYNMSEDMLLAASHAAHRVNLGTSPKIAVDSVLNMSETQMSVMPSANPVARIGLSHLSGVWKFLLVTNGEPTNPQAVSMWTRANGGRELYFGYFAEEPLNPLTLHMTEPTLNDNARMVITHKSVIQRYPAHAAQVSSLKFNTMSNASVLDPAVLTHLTTESLQLNDPLHLSQNADLTADNTTGTVYATPLPVAANDLSLTQGSVVFDAQMQTPRDNLGSLMKAAFMANSKLNSDEVMNHSERFSGNLTRSDTVSESMENYFQASTSTIRQIGLRPDTMHTLGMVRQQYHPDVFPIATDRSVMFSPADQSQRSPSVVFCSLLSSAIPPLLMKAQILHFAFQYETRSYDTNQPDVWVIHSVQSAVPMPEDLLRRNVDAVMYELRTGLFRMMLESRGDFAVHGSFGVANVTHCYVNFYADNERMLSPYEVPSILGGLTSSLIADRSTTFQNTSQYAQLLNAMTGNELTDNIPEMRDFAPSYSASGDRATGHTGLTIPPSIFTAKWQ